MAETRNDDVIVKLLDLSSLKSIKAFADDFNASTGLLLFLRVPKNAESGFS